MKRKASSSLMPIAFYFSTLVSFVVIVILLFQWIVSGNSVVIIPLTIFFLFLLYMVYTFSIFHKVEADQSFYYFTHMLTSKTEKVSIERIIEIRGLRLGFLDPFTKVLIYEDDRNNRCKLYYTPNFGLF